MNKKELLLYSPINFVSNLFHSLVQLLEGILYRIFKRYNGVCVDDINIYHCLCSQPGYKDKYCYSPTQFSVAIGYGAGV